MTRTVSSRLVPVLGTFALAVWSAACASSGAVPRPFPVPGGPTATKPTLPTETAVAGDTVASTALALRGAPYRNGGADPSGFDCSGFTQYVFGENGIALPREVREQYQIGREIDSHALEPGDLIFFSTTAPGPSHVAIAIGGDQFVHAPSSRGVVRVESLGSSYWSKRYIGARRIESTQ